MNTMRAMLILSVPFLIVAAAPRPGVDELIRRGNDAFEAKNFTEAIQHYEQAEKLTTDPGLVAFNKAAALYQLGLATKAPHQKTGYFQQAEEHYRCAAEDRAEPRRLLARFGLANSLMQGKPEDLAAVRRAIECYRECLKSESFEETMRADVRHNLEVARLIELRLRAKSNDEPRPQDQGDEKNPMKKPDPMTDPSGMGDPMRKEGDPKPTENPAETKNGEKPTPTKKIDAGAGKEGPEFDETPAPPLSPSAAASELESAVSRINERLQNSRKRSARLSPPGVKDW